MPTRRLTSMVVFGGGQSCVYIGNVAALVISPSSRSLATGWAGEDTPKSVIGTDYGYMEDNSTSANGMQVDAGPAGHSPYIGDNGPMIWRAGMGVANPLRQGLIEDFDAFGSLLESQLSHQLKLDASAQPIIMTEPWSNSKAHRQRTTEMMFEQFKVPGFYLANDGVMTAFAAGKHTALIVNVGTDISEAIPVVDGFALKKGIFRQELGSSHVSKSLLQMFAAERNIADALFPHQLIASKGQATGPGEKPSYTLRDDRISQTPESWKKFASECITSDWRDHVAQILETGWDEEKAAAKPVKTYEFPNGYYDNYGVARLRASEILFNPKAFWTPLAATSAVPSSIGEPSIPMINDADKLGLHDLLLKSVLATDADARSNLMSNIVLTGPGSTIPGLADRLTWELNTNASSFKCRMHAPGNSVERKYAPWIGASITASLGTFHQLWISKAEYDEVGSDIVNRRCK